MPQKLVAKDRDDWLAKRREGIGSSEAAAALGIAPSPLLVYERKLGIEANDSDTIPRRVGRALEGTIQELFTEETGVEILDTQVFLRSEDHPFMLATLDGMAADGKVVEFKTISVRRASELGDVSMEEVPPEWLCQVNHQMTVAGVGHAYIAVLVGNEAFRVYPVERNPDLCEILVEREAELWDRVLKRMPPPPSDSDSYSTVMRSFDRFESGIQLSPDVERMVAAAHFYGRLATLADKARDDFRKEIATRLGNATVGVTPAGWSVRRTPRVRKEYVVPSCSFVTMSIKPPKGLNDVATPCLPECPGAGHADPQGVRGDHGSEPRETREHPAPDAQG